MFRFCCCVFAGCFPRRGAVWWDICPLRARTNAKACGRKRGEGTRGTGRKAGGGDEIDRGRAATTSEWVRWCCDDVADRVGGRQHRSRALDLCVRCGELQINEPALCRTDNLGPKVRVLRCHWPVLPRGPTRLSCRSYVALPRVGVSGNREEQASLRALT